MKFLNLDENFIITYQTKKYTPHMIVKNEKPENIRNLAPQCDDNLANMLDIILDNDEEKRAVVFSEVTSFIEIY